MPAELAVGDKAPDFSLPDETGQPVSLKKFRGRQVVLYFYPKDDTPGCTKEACGFRDSMTPILKAGKSAVLNVTLKKGKYKFICSITGHATLGMNGTLLVT